MSTLKEILYDELRIKAELSQEGVTFDPAILQKLNVGTARQEQIHCLFNTNRESDTNISLPSYFNLPNGLLTAFLHDRKAPNRLETDGKDFFIVRQNGDAIAITLGDRPGYYAEKTSDGTPMGTVAINTTGGVACGNGM